ncbi:MAG: HD domain-containing protein, partial [Solirubrobacterales bacterium]
CAIQGGPLRPTSPAAKIRAVTGTADEGRRESAPEGAEAAGATPERPEAAAGAPPERPDGAAGPDAQRRGPAEAVAAAEVHAPTRGNRKLERFLAAVNADERVRAWWYMAQVTSQRLGMSDHSWVHVQVVLNISLRLLRLLAKGGIEPAMVADHHMKQRDAEVVVAGGALLHDVGMSIHRADHEAYSLFLAADRLDSLLEGVYDEPERSVVIAEALHCVIGHRRRGEPYTVEAGVVRVADALDMAQGRSRIPIEGGQFGIHALSAAAIEEVRIEAGEERPVKVEIEMNNSAGIFQVDDLLATKIRGTPLEGAIEVTAHVPGETEKRLLPSFRI